MIAIFFGSPGSGKGTQAQRLTQALKDVIHVSTGDLLRKEIALKSDLGCKIQSDMQAGKFPEDGIIMRLVEDVIKKDAKKDIIFDGFPRTLNQAIALDALLGVENLKVDIVFDFDIDISNLVGRISGRYMCQECGAVYHEKNKRPQVDGICDQCGSSCFEKRVDDREQVFEVRLKAYQDQTLPVKKHYSDRGVLEKINASLSQDEVALCIGAALLKAGLIEGEK